MNDTVAEVDQERETSRKPRNNKLKRNGKVYHSE